MIAAAAAATAQPACAGRKVKRGAANLLGGRAIRYELHGLTASELAGEFDLDRMLNHGYLPRIYEASRPNRLLDAYIADYLKEEVAAEGLVRNLPTFSDFLDVAALSDCEIVNFSNIARECGVSSHTTKNHFQILEDTLLGRWLPAYRKRPKRRVIGAPKFYFVDVGIVNRLARRGELHPGSELYGKAFENWIFHELTAFSNYRGCDSALSYWRLASGIEVDFVLGDMAVAIEAKSTVLVRLASSSPSSSSSSIGRLNDECRSLKSEVRLLLLQGTSGNRGCIRPEPLQLIELSHRRVEDVDDKVHIIQQHPASWLDPFHVMCPAARLVQRTFHVFGQGADVHVRRSRRNDEVVSSVAELPQVENNDVYRLVVIQRTDS